MQWSERCDSKNARELASCENIARLVGLIFSAADPTLHVHCNVVCVVSAKIRARVIYKHELTRLACCAVRRRIGSHSVDKCHGSFVNSGVHFRNN